MSSGGLDSSVTLDEVFTVLGARRVPLAPELAGYLSLEIAEHADPAGGDVDPRSVFVSEEGTVALVKPRREGAAGDAETSVRAILARLLEASGTQTPALAAASKRTGGPGLPALAEELETALIPVNRAAGRRALARLAREVRRVTLGVGRNASPATGDALPPTRRASHPSNPSATPPPPAVEAMPRPAMTASMPPPADFPREEDPTTARAHIPEELLRRAVPAEASEMPTMQFEPAGAMPVSADVDALIADFGVSEGGEQRHARELKAMAGLEPTPPPPSAPIALVRRSSAPPSSGSGDGGIDSLLAVSAEPAPKTIPSPPPPRPPRVSTWDQSRQLPTGPSELRRTTRTPTPVPRRSGSGILAVVALAAVGAGGYGVWTLRPHDAPAPARAIAPAPEPAPVQCRATLIVNDVPARAEVLLHAGQAPVDVEKMPVGARLEFVATAEGYAPKRVVVPAGASWERGPDGKPRFETAVQLDRSAAKIAGSDPWPPVEPGSEVGGEGPPGTVHVVATPHGAEVWMLAGMGPQARIEQLQCNHDVDVLVAGPTSFRRRLHVQASDFAVEPVAGPAAAPPAKGTTRVARVSAK
jgi:hypothetical protein